MIGIAIPSYRAADTLAETLRSCVAQSFKDWIAFVTIDGEDATLEAKIVEQIGDPRIRLECNHRRLGQMTNFNRAILRCYTAGAQWIKPFSADDVLYPDALDRMLEVGSRSTNCGLVFGYFDVIDEAGIIVSTYDISELETQIVASREFTRRVVPFGNPTGGPSSVMFRADVIEHCGLFDGRLDYAGDREFWFRIASRFDVGVVGRGPILGYRRHDNSVSGREHTKPVFFEELMDVGRMMATSCAPFSRQWFLSHLYLGRMGGCNFSMALGHARRCRFGVANMAAKITLRRLSPLSFPIAIWQLARIFLLGGLKRPTVFEAAPIESATVVTPLGRSSN